MPPEEGGGSSGADGLGDIPNSDMPPQPTAEPRPEPTPTGPDTPVSNTDTQATPATTTATTTAPSTGGGQATPEPAAVTEQATTTPAVPETLVEANGATLYVGLILGAFALVAGAYGLAKVFQTSKEKSDKGDNKCEQIRIDLELKERALDALKDQAAKAVGLEAIKKLNDDIHDMANLVQKLRNQYQLCTLEVPDIEGLKMLKFLAPQVPLVVARTLRSVQLVRDEVQVEEGDEVRLINADTGKQFGVGTIDSVVDIPDTPEKRVEFTYERGSV